MKTFYVAACVFSFLTILCAEELSQPACLERETGIGLLETAEDVLTKAEETYPSCQEDANAKDPVDCSGQKSLAFIEILRKLISEVKENFPTCKGTKVIVPQIKRKDCSEILSNGGIEDGVFTIWLTLKNKTEKPVQVYCDMETDGGGWTLIQRRGKFPVQQNFEQGWESYKNGFGKITEEFWLGNENIRLLCLNGCTIRFDLKNEKAETRYAVYRNFKLSGSDYIIEISGYKGNAGDAMVHHNKRVFSTKDNDYAGKGKEVPVGWWHSLSTNSCNLNGIYRPGVYDIKSVYWYYWQNVLNTAKVEIKVRPNY